MKPITISITNLIGTMIIIGDKENTSAQIQESVSDALLKVISKSQNLENPELYQDKILSELTNCQNLK